MPIRIDIFHHFSAEDIASLQKFGDRIVAQVDDMISHMSTSLDAIIAAATGDFTNLEAKIAELQAQIAAGGDTPERIASLSALQAKLDDAQTKLATLMSGGGGGGPGLGAGGPGQPGDATTAGATAATATAGGP